MEGKLQQGKKGWTHPRVVWTFCAHPCLCVCVSMPWLWSCGVSCGAAAAVASQVRPGELVCVVGRVGSGKSSLLAAALGEMEPNLSGERSWRPYTHTHMDMWLA